MTRVRAVLRQLSEASYWVPVTPLGLGVLAAAYSVDRVVGREQMDLVLHAGALVAVGLVGLSGVSVVLATASLARRLRRAGDASADLALESGVRAATGYSFPRLSAWPLVQVELTWCVPDDVQVAVERIGGRMQEVVCPHLRGDHPHVVRRFIVSDIFGLARLGLRRTAKQRARIDPGPAQLSGHVLTHFVGGDGLSYPHGPASGDRLDMRRYAPGDPLRHILWKAYARTRQVLVRTPERAISPSPSAMAYFVAGAEDEPSASAARAFIEAGLLGDDFLFGADGAARATTNAREAIDQIVGSVAFRSDGARDLERFVEQGIAAQRRSCILFVPPLPGPWLCRVLQIARRVPGTSALLAIDRELPGERASWLQRMLFAPGDADAAGLRRVPEVVRALTRAGIAVKVLHRPTGEFLAQAQVEALAP